MRAVVFVVLVSVARFRKDTMSAFKQFKQSFARIFRSKSEVGPNYGSSSPPSYLTLAKTRSEDRTDGDELLLSGTDIIVQDVDGAAAGDGDKTSQNSSDSGVYYYVHFMLSCISNLLIN